MVWTIRSCAMADLFQFGRPLFEGIFRENLRSIDLPLWRYDHPGFWPRGWSQELNVPSEGQVAEAFLQFACVRGKGHSLNYQLKLAPRLGLKLTLR